MKREALFYEKIQDKVHCFLCPHNCVIDEGRLGKCNVRVNENGKLFTTNYGEITSLSLDPIEKKPLHFFRPNTWILSAGSFGCNFSCGFCQNYSISQMRAESSFMPPEILVEKILTIKNNTGIAFTYNEPGIWYEYVYDCARLLKKKDENKAVVLVTNGYISEKPLQELLPFVDALNIDLKSFKQAFYRDLCGGNLKPVLKTIETAQKTHHVEITTLLVSEKNDNLEEVEEISKFLSSLSPEIPLHLSRYFPRYKFKNSPTEINFMKKAEEVSKKYLNKVVLGNV